MRLKYILFSLAAVPGLMALLLVSTLSPAQADFKTAHTAVSPTAPTDTEDFVYTAWQLAANAPFAFTRFDAEYSPTTGKVYFLGGRLGSGDTDGSIWEFDPVTGVYADTGVDMPVPISNYQIVRLVESGGDEVMVTFGGRPAAGGTVNTVQGYKPASNTVVNYTATDPYPAITAPGGVVAVNNIAYSFGGFDGAAMIANTYIFDITAAPGSRWTAGPNLNMARSYIGATAVDGYIYAIGGDTFDGAALIAQTIAERLDTANPTAWDDAGVADLPIACDENQAFGFDTGSDYDLAGAIVLGGCGQWTNELAESLLYDVANNSWDITFPDLNEARRNHAGAFVPNGVGLNGQPGMWVWGGRQGSDANVLITPEFYNVVPLADFTLVPRDQLVEGFGTVTVNAGASNRSGADETFDLTYSSSLGWVVNGPASVFVADGDLVAFGIDVTIPANADCADVNVVTIDGVGQANTSLTDSIQAQVKLLCQPGVGGVIDDANTGLPVPNAYIYIEDVSNPSNVGEAFADDDGEYLILGVTPGDYYLAVSAEGYQFSILPSGWPTGAIQITILPDAVTVQNVTLNAPIMEWSDTAYSETLTPGAQVTRTLVISNSGTSELYFSLGTYLSGIDPLPRSVEMPRPSYRIDPRIMAELGASEAGTTDFIVFMAEQADLSAAYGISDWNARGQYVYETLLATAERSQQGARYWLDAQGVPYRPFLASNAILVYGGSLEAVNALAARPEVAYLLANDEVPLETQKASWWQSVDTAVRAALSPEALEWGILAVNADEVWVNEANTGENIIVANIDSGVQWNHPALVNQYRGGPGNHDYNWYMPTSGCAGQTEPCDNNGHGTHTMGTMVGSDNPADPVNATNGIGVAPGAEWIACKGCETNSCSFEALLMCGDWMVAPTDLNGQNPDPAQRPHIVNNSWGGGSGDFWYGGVVGAWRASGMFPQFSAGNSGPSCSTTGSPGDYVRSYNSAAVDISLNAAAFSSRGPAAVTGILKPNISAPGVAVRSSVPGNGYALFNGTSMASPHVAGVTALLWSAKPELIGQIEDTMWLLSQTASPLLTAQTCGNLPPNVHPNNTFGWGLVDALAAVTDATEIVPPWVEVVPGGGTVLPSESMTVQIVFTAPDIPGVYSGTLQLTADEPYNPEVLIPLELTVEVNAPVANFDHNGPIELGETAVFTNTTTGTEPLTYLWDFGDSITSTAVHPSHVYTATGTYTVTLTATNAAGSSTATAVFVVNPAAEPVYWIYLPVILKP